MHADPALSGFFASFRSRLETGPPPASLVCEAALARADTQSELAVVYTLEQPHALDLTALPPNSA